MTNYKASRRTVFFFYLSDTVGDKKRSLYFVTFARELVEHAVANIIKKY